MPARALMQGWLGHRSFANLSSLESTLRARTPKPLGLYCTRRVERTPRAAAARRRGGGASANCKNAGAGTKSDQNPRRDDGDANTIIGTRRPQDAMTQWTQPVAPVVANADRRRVPLALDNTHHTIHTLLFTSHDHLPHQ